MSLTFIPTVWAARLLSALDKELVYGQTNVSNRDYEGDIRVAGNTVKIASIGDVTIGDYEKDTPIGDPDILTDTDQTMLIDQQKFFHFFVDSVDRAQQNVNVLDEAMRRSAWKLRDAADTYIASLMDAAIPVDNQIGTLVTPIEPTADDAYEYLVDLASSSTNRTRRSTDASAWCRHGSTGCCSRTTGSSMREQCDLTVRLQTARSAKRQVSPF